MVKLGIICEGESEPFVLDTPTFKAFVAQFDLELIAVVQAGGKKEYGADRINKHRQILIDRGAEHIIVLVDLDTDACITLTKQQINSAPNQTIIVAVNEFENWYLADSQALSSFLGVAIEIDLPEHDSDAITTIIDMGKAARQFARYRKSKVLLAKDMQRHGFTIERAAAHENCPSARYFLTKLQTLASAN